MGRFRFYIKLILLTLANNQVTNSNIIHSIKSALPYYRLIMGESIFLKFANFPDLILYLLRKIWVASAISY